MANPDGKPKAYTAELSAQDIENSRALDSPRAEKDFDVNKLTKLPDGMTLVKYSFMENNAQSEFYEKIFHEPCDIPDESMRENVREVIDRIVRESKAKIRFVESDAASADIVLTEHYGIRNPQVAALKPILPGNEEEWAGEATRVYDKSVVIISPDVNRKIIRDAYRKFSTVQYGDSVIESQVNKALKTVIAHEIEHTLGAKDASWPDEEGKDGVAGNEKTMDTKLSSKETVTVMNLFSPADGMLLGLPDIAWYQRRFGMAEPATQDEVKAPAPVSVTAEILRKTR